MTQPRPVIFTTQLLAPPPPPPGARGENPPPNEKNNPALAEAGASTLPGTDNSTAKVAGHPVV